MGQKTRIYSSFRDPAGSVHKLEGKIHRDINPRYRPDYDLLMSSGLYSKLISEGLLIPHTESGNTLSPEKIEVISFPYEWGFETLKDAAISTLRIQDISLDYGLELKDASAYNIQFHRGRMLLIDTLSIMKKEPNTPWVAYGQFCRHFLGPLALMAKVDTRLGQLTRLYLDGIPLDLVSDLLPFSLNSGLNFHLKLHSKFITQKVPGSKIKTKTVSPESQKLLLRNLLNTVQGLTTKSSSGDWSSYDNCSYSRMAFDSKFQVVTQILKESSPKTVLDLGANTGNYSRLAHRLGSKVISVDQSFGCIDVAYGSRSDYPNLLPLLLDITNPGSGVGWESQERPPLQERVKPNLVLALALIHHLAISSAIPLDYLSKYFRNWNCPVLIEFVPKEDPQTGKLFPGGCDIFPGYTEKGFTQVFGQDFKICGKYPILDSFRTLYYLVPKDFDE